MITFIHQGQEVTEAEYRAASEAEYTIKYNRTTNHIAGIAERSNGSDLNYAQSACPVLTRSYNLATGKTFTSAAKALESARKGGRKVCKHCEAAALAS
jgi:hypothetical protein